MDQEHSIEAHDGDGTSNAESAVAQASIPATDDAGTSRTRKRLLVGGALGAAAVIIAAIVVVAVQPSKLEAAYNDCAGDAWDGSTVTATLLDSGDTLALEMTDGIDELSVSLGYEIYYTCVFDELGISDATLSRMSSTRALDGMQTDTSNGLTLSWTYHPDNGLDVLIENGE